MTRLSKRHGLAAAVLIVFITAIASSGPAAAATKRCGWLQNPTPANWFFTDAQGQWTLGVQGGYQAPYLDQMPDLSERDWQNYPESNHGYGCVCMNVETDGDRITTVTDFQQRPIAACRRDKALPAP